MFKEYIMKSSSARDMEPGCWGVNLWKVHYLKLEGRETGTFFRGAVMLVFQKHHPIELLVIWDPLYWDVADSELLSFLK